MALSSGRISSLNMLFFMNMTFLSKCRWRNLPHQIPQNWLQNASCYFQKLPIHSNPVTITANPTIPIPLFSRHPTLTIPWFPQIPSQLPLSNFLKRFMIPSKDPLLHSRSPIPPKYKFPHIKMHSQLKSLKSWNSDFSFTQVLLNQILHQIPFPQFHLTILNLFLPSVSALLSSLVPLLLRQILLPPPIQNQIMILSYFFCFYYKLS